MPKKLFRTVNNRVMSGVCSGFGLYFNIDAVLVRFIWILLTIFEPFVGLLAYFVCAIAIPDENNISVDYTISDYDNKRRDNYNKENAKNNDSKSLGLVLVGIGSVLLLKKVFDYFNLINIFELWPLLLIFAGLYVLLRKKDK